MKQSESVAPQAAESAMTSEALSPSPSTAAAADLRFGGYTAEQVNQFRAEALARQGFPVHSVLRDWFAGMALQGLLSADAKRSVMQIETGAEQAYRIADAMLAAREETHD